MLDNKSTEAYRTIARELAEKFAPRAAEWDETRAYCWPNVADLTDAGLMGMTISKRYGGQGASYLDACVVIEEIARACTLSSRIVVEANMGGIAAIMAYGSEDQKAFAADLVLKGDKPAICITEPETGSAATEMRTTARRDGNRYILNGAKHWITGGGISKLHVIFARVENEAGKFEGIGAFMVACDPVAGVTPAGFTVTERRRTMGLCGMPEAELRFDNLIVEDHMTLVPPSGFKRGFADLMTAYNSQRVAPARWRSELPPARSTMPRAT